MYIISLFSGCVLAKGWGCICNFNVSSFYWSSPSQKTTTKI
jgi:hypothetical protein